MTEQTLGLETDVEYDPLDAVVEQDFTTHEKSLHVETDVDPLDTVVSEDSIRKGDRYYQGGWKVATEAKSTRLHMDALISTLGIDTAYNLFLGASAGSNDMLGGLTGLVATAGRKAGFDTRGIQDLSDSMLTWAKRQRAQGIISESDFVDRLAWSIGHMVPATIGALVVGEVGPPLLAVAGLGRMAHYWRGFNWAQAGSRTAGGTLMTMSQEYADATKEGREPQLWDAIKTDAMFNFAFGSVFTFANSLKLRPKDAIAFTSGLGAAITHAAGAPPEDVAAAAIVFAAMGHGKIRNIGPEAPPEAQAVLRGYYGNVKDWVKSRQANGLGITPDDYMQEFHPTWYQQVMNPSGISKTLDAALKSNELLLSPWDALILKVEEDFGLGLNLTGVTPDTLAAHMWAETKARNEHHGFTKEEFINMHTMIAKATEAQNAKFMDENPEYQPQRTYDPKVTFLDKVGEPDREVFLLRDLKPEDKYFYKDRKGNVAYTLEPHPKTKGMRKVRLKLEDLTLTEALRLLDDPAVLNESGMAEAILGAPITDSGIASVVRAKHYNLVQKKLASGSRVKTYILKDYKDDLGKKYHHRYTRTKSFADTFEPHPETELTDAEVWSKQMFEHKKSEAELEIKTIQESKGWLETFYTGVIDVAGFTPERLRAAGFDDVVDALNIRYGATSKTYHQWSMLDEATGIKEWEPSQINFINTYYDAIVQKTFANRRRRKQQKFKTTIPDAQLDQVINEGMHRAMNGEYPGGPDKLLSDIEAIHSTMTGTLDYAYSNGLIPKHIFDDISGDHYLPQRTVPLLMDHLRHIGTESMLRDQKNVVDRLRKELDPEGRIVDVPWLVQSHVARVNQAVATNRVAQAMMKYAREDPQNPSFRLTDPGGWVEVKHYEDGVQTSVFVDPKMGNALDSTLIQNMTEGLDNVKLHEALGWISGAKLDRLFISGSPWFAATQIVPDMMHIVMSHPEFHPSPAAVGHLSSYTSLYRASLQYFKGDPDKGVQRYDQNVSDVWSKGPVYQAFMDAGGSTISLARNQGTMDFLSRSLKGATGWEPEPTRRGTGSRILKPGLEAIKDDAKVVLNHAKDTIDTMQGLSHAMEMGGRLTEWQMLMAADPDMPPERAAGLVNQRLNYSKAGKWTRHLRSYVPFLMPGLAATDTTVKFVINDFKKTRGRTTGRLMAQLAFGYAGVRAINETIAPDADKDRPMEDRLYKTLLFFPWDQAGGFVGLGFGDPSKGGAQQRDPLTNEKLRYGIELKDGMNPLSATTKFMTILAQDYYYDLVRGREPKEWGEKEIAGVWDTIRASTPAALHEFIPSVADLVSIYAMNKKTMRIRAGDVYMGDPTSPEMEINARSDLAVRGGFGAPTSDLAIGVSNVANKVVPTPMAGLPPLYFLTSPSAVDAVFNSFVPPNVAVDTVGTLQRMMGFNNGFMDYTGYKYVADKFPGISRIIGRTHPAWAQRDYMMRAKRAAQAKLDKAVERKIEPYKNALLNEMYLPDIATPEQLTKSMAIFQKHNIELMQTDWHDQKSFKKIAMQRFSDYYEAISKHWRLKWTIQSMLKDQKDSDKRVDLKEALMALGPWSSWKSIFTGNAAPEDRADWLMQPYMGLRKSKVLSKAKVDALFYSLLKLESLSGDTKFEFMKRQTKYNERMSK